MRIVEAFFNNGEILYVDLEKDVLALNHDNIVTSTSRLREKLEKKRVEHPNVVGIIDGGVLQINLYEDQKWDGIVWSSRTRLSGSWKMK